MATDRGRIRRAVVVGESAGVNLFVFGVCVCPTFSVFPTYQLLLRISVLMHIDPYHLLKCFLRMNVSW